MYIKRSVTPPCGMSLEASLHVLAQQSKNASVYPQIHAKPVDFSQSCMNNMLNVSGFLHTIGILNEFVFHDSDLQNTLKACSSGIQNSGETQL